MVVGLAVKGFWFSWVMVLRSGLMGLLVLAVGLTSSGLRLMRRCMLVRVWRLQRLHGFLLGLFCLWRLRIVGLRISGRCLRRCAVVGSRFGVRRRILVGLRCV